MFRYANPARFLKLSARLVPLFGILTGALFLAGVYLALFVSPPDYLQDETVRIMYVHVPAAWLALAVYASMAVSAVVALIWRHTLADLYVRAVAPLGAGFTAICLITGSLWGLPTWGTWWVWDARLTSVLILFFLYVGYIALVQAFDDEDKSHTAGNILVLAGAVNIPVIKFSVDWWNTLHQPASVFRLSGPAIDAAMLKPLLVMALAFLSFFILTAFLRLQAEIQRRRRRVQILKRAETI